MMSQEEGLFTLEWRIKNFSMCHAAEFRSFILSPVFVMGNEEWILKLHPKGLRYKGFLSIYLICISSIDPVNLEFNVYVFPDSPAGRYTKPFSVNKSWGKNKLISRWKMLKDKDKYLPNDTLTLKCVMKKENYNPKDTAIEIFDSWNRVVIEMDSLTVNKCSIETLIMVHNRSLTWPIKNFRSLPTHKRITMPLISTMKKVPGFFVTVFKTSKSSLQIEISRTGEEVSENTFVRCSVSVTNALKDTYSSTKGELLFKKNHLPWNFAIVEDWNTIKDDKYFKNTGGVLYLHFQLSFTSADDVLHSERSDWCPDVLQPPEQITPDESTTLITYDESPIVYLRAQDQTFEVHKSVLKANSEALSAMFEVDTTEGETGVVDVPDVDSTTLGRMIDFFYSGTAGDLSTTADYGKLYALAHRYRAQSLVDFCSSKIVSSLTASNVCEVLCLAELYGDDWLWKSAEAFAIADSDRVLVSSEWKDFMQDKSSLAAKVMYKMLIK